MNSVVKRVVSLLLTVLLFFQGTENLQAYAASTLEEASEKTEQIVSEHHEPEILGEIIELREQNVKHFRMADGSFKAFSYGYPVHYLDNSNVWQEINNTPVLVTNEKLGNVYQVENANHCVLFSSVLENGCIFSATHDGASVAISALDSTQAQVLSGNGLSASDQAGLVSEGMTYNRNATALIGNDAQTAAPLSRDENAQGNSNLTQNLKSTVLYEDVFPGVDYRYTLWSYNIKEEIIIRQLQDSYQYKFFLELNDLTARRNDNGSISLLNNEHEEVFYIPAPYMVDASGAYSDQVVYRLTAADGGVVLSVEADEEWIESDSRTLPVTIDPSITTRVSGATHTALDDIYATYVHPAYPNSSLYNSDYLYTGYSGNYLSSPYITYLYFNNIPEIPTGCIISEASLKMLMLSYSGAGCANMPIGMFRVTDPVPEGSTAHGWISGLTYSNKPSYDKTNVIDFVSTSSSAADTYLYWDITELARGWYAGNTDRAVALDAVGTFGSSGYASQSYRSTGDYISPIMEVTYRSGYGIEPYYTYQTLSAGEAGTAYIADATGQMKIVKNILGYHSEVNPFSLNLVYNSDYFINTEDNYLPPNEMGLNMSIGAGWTLDCIQTISDETIGTTYYLKHRDGDGTIHYYKKPSSTTTEFYDEDGLGLTMKQVGNNTYRIMDHLSNYSLFNNRVLTEVSDWDGNKININYTDGKITSITQKNDGCAEITLAVFGYSGNVVTSITDAAGNIYIFEYDGQNLSAIRRGETVIAQFTYNGYHVASMRDAESSYTLNFSYDTMDRISGFGESVDTTPGARITVEYPDRNQIRYTDTGWDRVSGNGDDLRYSYLFDHAGRTINTYVTDRNNKVYGASMGAYSEQTSTDRRTNHILRSASTGVVARQLLRNSGLELGNWTHDSTSVSTAMPRTGVKSIQGTATNSSAVQSAQTTSESLTAGTAYTFSAYVKTSGMAFPGTGIYLKVSDTAENVWTGEALNYDTSGVDDGWARISVSFTARVSGTHTVEICREGAEGTFYADDFQLEEGEAPSNHNLVENGSMLSASGWTLGTGASVSGGTLSITGDGYSTTTNASQVIALNQLPGQTYVLSGWAKAEAAPDTAHTNSDPAQDTCKQFGLRAVLTYSGGTKEYHYIPFNTDITDWQFISLAVVPQRNETVASVQVVCAYEQNVNTAQFDNISFVREVAQQMTYDSNGMLLSVTSTHQATDKDTYNDIRLLTKRETAGNGTYTYHYADPNNSYRITQVKNSAVTQNFSYNTTGNLLTTTVTGSDGSKMVTSSTYSADANRVATVTDTAGNTVSYQYSSDNSVMRGLPTSVTAPNGTVTQNSYDLFGRVTQTSVAQLGTMVYNYLNGSISTVTRTASGKTQTYALGYDPFGNNTSIAVGGRTLTTCTYGPGNGLLLRQTYGSEENSEITVTYTYDILGRVRTAAYSDGLTLTYTYNGNGNLSLVAAAKGGAETKYLYNYDSLGRVISSERKDNSATVLRTRLGYDDVGRLSTQVWQLGSTTYTESFTYNSSLDGSLNTHTNALGQTLTMGYDGLRRLSTVTGGIYGKTYTYRNVGSNTTTQVAGLVYDLPTDQTFGYTYDNMGNIAAYTDSNGTVTYTYDALGQLKKAVGSTTYNYTYDNAGNILSGNGHTYTYGDSTWADLLTAVDGETITYDPVGNPTSYYNGTRWAFTWAHGRNLETAAGGGNTLSFAYDADGLRTSKTVGGVVHTYYYASGKLLRETYGTNTLDFFYDASGNAYAFKYNGTLYYYITNLQGDVMSIVDAQGAVVASYQYDPYGNVLAATGDIAEVNPLRYRGYYYDSETGFYYLQSRYYDPEIGRFLNADTFASTGQGLLGYNMFAYCNNNPLNHTDSSGTSPLLIVVCGGALGGAIVGLIYAHINDMSFEDTVITVIGGAVSGGFGAPVAVLSGGPKILCIIAAAGASGFTAEATDGRFEIGFIVGLGGTLLGTKFPTALLRGEELFWANTLATMGTSVPAEMVSQGLNQDLDTIQDLLSDESVGSLGGGSSIPLGLRGMGTGAG